MTEADIKRIVAESVKQTLTEIGVNLDEPFEFQKDMAYLRGWRTSSDTIKRQSVLTAVGLLTAGFLGAVLYIIRGH
ncbi:hypothetical protein X766_15890 [Mesorhizobium sp. LSJC255A00]|uniref:hypothetical protein n=1 Tax=Mesorhizobium sp. LSJC255A00 TaxID=1287313 RepID=UPI0003CF3547|nr:hypothetical protein [Mesorhizobium sp. LSJC255A00]ESX17877.1 hypothetical protein X766_15890 [Mesorhizobium sp. LSJC255A00]